MKAYSFAGIVTSLLHFASPTLAQITATSALPAQTSEFRHSLKSYYRDFQRSPEISSIGFALLLNDDVPNGIIGSITANIDSLLPVPTTGSIDLYSLATDPPLTFPTLDFESQLPNYIQNDIKSLQTSAALYIASMDQEILGITASINTERLGQNMRSTDMAIPARHTAVAGAAVIMAGAVGAAAILL